MKLVQFDFSVTWVVVDDGSTDDSLKVLRESTGGFPVQIISTRTSGKLSQGGAFQAWNEGIKYAKSNIPNFTHLMKLDADVSLKSDFFLMLLDSLVNPKVGITGGVIIKGGREQNLHVPGPAKIYSRECLRLLETLPLQAGFDVMDEVVAMHSGLEVIISKKAKITLTRNIGNSQGILHGRRRNGMVCRWTGYYPLYFGMHLFRYMFRKPYIFGSVWMFYGYISAKPSPYPKYLRSLHSDIQRKKVRNLLKRPRYFLRNVYAID